MNIADLLNKKIIELKAPIVVGLDPTLPAIPDVYKSPYLQLDNPLEAVAKTILDFNKDIVDSVYEIVPAVKPQCAFYEKYGHWGFWAFEESIKYAKSKGMVVIADGKRNDIGSTATAYAEAFLGEVELLDGRKSSSIGADLLTVSPFLGRDGIAPFVETCEKQGKGIFVLVKTSNPSSSDIQNQVTVGRVAQPPAVEAVASHLTIENGRTIFEGLAAYVNEVGKNSIGDSGYSAIGAVVGATYPKEAEVLRQLMPKSIFLVPGYGAQGGGAKDVAPCFNKDKLGAIVNSSRGIMCAYKEKYKATECSKEQYKATVQEATLKMREDISSVL